jgi:hypothetical protein
MKLVFNTAEVAAALGQTPDEFFKLRASLEALGFPKPISGLQNTWSIMNVINWVNTEKQRQSEAA